MANMESMRTFDVEGQVVRCVESGGDRLWRCECECEYFQRMLAKHGQGFCPHVAIAIGEAAESDMFEEGAAAATGTGTRPRHAT